MMGGKDSYDQEGRTLCSQLPGSGTLAATFYVIKLYF